MKQSQKNPIIDVKRKSYQYSTLRTSTTIIPKPVLKTQKPKEKKRILRGQDATPNNDHKKLSPSDPPTLPTSADNVPKTQCTNEKEEK